MAGVKTWCPLKARMRKEALVGFPFCTAETSFATGLSLSVSKTSLPAFTCFTNSASCPLPISVLIVIDLSLHHSVYGVEGSADRNVGVTEPQASRRKARRGGLLQHNQHNFRDQPISEYPESGFFEGDVAES